ncbi:hypothetical protein HG530_001921 [Fusarium avenaceum]|nr:hypothetical protein HG530_001921 [Fusarium avenaceum]
MGSTLHDILPTAHRIVMMKQNPTASVVNIVVAASRTKVQRTVQSVEAVSADLGRHILESNAEDESTTAPEKTSNRCGNESAKGTPVVAVQTLLHEEKLTSFLGVAVVDTTKDEDSQNTAKTTYDYLKAAPPVELVNETNDENWDGGGRDKIGDEPDLKNRWRLEGNDDNRDDDEYDDGTAVPDVELVPEQVVGSRGNHGGLETIEGSCAQGDHHNENNTDDPTGEGLEEDEEGHRTRTSGVVFE